MSYLIRYTTLIGNTREEIVDTVPRMEQLLQARDRHEIAVHSVREVTPAESMKVHRTNAVRRYLDATVETGKRCRCGNCLCCRAAMNPDLYVAEAAA